MPKITIFCTIVGRNSVFSVDIRTSRTVGDLKDEIKEKKAITLVNYEADALTLYRGAIEETPNKEERDERLSRLSQILNQCTFLDAEDLLSKHFGDGPPEGLKYYVIVVIPEGESI